MSKCAVFSGLGEILQKLQTTVKVKNTLEKGVHEARNMSLGLFVSLQILIKIW